MDAPDYWRRLSTLAGLGAADHIQQMLSSMPAEQISACVAYGAATMREVGQDAAREASTRRKRRPAPPGTRNRP
jgi:hypothetical protein